ncbi:MAG: hypothetical protein JST54_05160 [Deltaproteobacteria bacterium]|nr:hypothetical protein [Deltaproteobacteria bacterium]
MSLRVDLYPIQLATLSAHLRGRAGDAQALAAELKTKLPALDPAIVEALLGGTLGPSTMPVESEPFASLMCRLAYRVRPPEPPVLFDLGGLWNALAQLSGDGALEGEPAHLASFLLGGRPMVGVQIDSAWSSYAWISSGELDAFTVLLDRAEPMAKYDVSQARPWLAEVRRRELEIFVAVG